MKRTRSKNMVLLTAVAMVFLFAAGTSYAATVYINGPTEVQGLFSFDVMIGDIGSLSNFDEWNLGLTFDPLADATFVGATDLTLDPDYVFYGDSFDYGIALLDPYRIVVGDLTAAGDGSHVDVADMLLATITVDVSTAAVGDWYSIVLFDAGYSYFGDTEFVYEEFPDTFSLAEYQFQVVPIPGTLLLLGSGLLGLIGLRRRHRGA